MVIVKLVVMFEREELQGDHRETPGESDLLRDHLIMIEWNEWLGKKRYGYYVFIMCYYVWIIYLHL